MKLIITYDIRDKEAQKNYREYLANRKCMLNYYEEIGDLLKKEKYEKDNPWVNFEEYIKNFGIEELEEYNLIDNRKIELKNGEEEV